MYFVDILFFFLVFAMTPAVLFCALRRRYTLAGLSQAQSFLVVFGIS